MSYRSGHHSTSDDSSRYRAAEEMRAWRARDPVTRFQHWLVSQGWWSDAQDTAARQAARKCVGGGRQGPALLPPLRLLARSRCCPTASAPTASAPNTGSAPPPVLPPPRRRRREVIAALEAAQHEPKPPISAMFEDVYAEMPWHLRRQLNEVLTHVAAHPDACPPDIPVR